jgi:hypothetical protein
MWAGAVGRLALPGIPTFLSGSPELRVLSSGSVHCFKPDSHIGNIRPPRGYGRPNPPIDLSLEHQIGPAFDPRNNCNLLRNVNWLLSIVAPKRAKRYVVRLLARLDRGSQLREP